MLQCLSQSFSKATILVDRDAADRRVGASRILPVFACLCGSDSVPAALVLNPLPSSRRRRRASSWCTTRASRRRRRTLSSGIRLLCNPSSSSRSRRHPKPPTHPHFPNANHLAYRPSQHPPSIPLSLTALHRHPQPPRAPCSTSTAPTALHRQDRQKLHFFP